MNKNDYTQHLKKYEIQRNLHDEFEFLTNPVLFTESLFELEWTFYDGYLYCNLICCVTQ